MAGDRGYLNRCVRLAGLMAVLLLAGSGRVAQEGEPRPSAETEGTEATEKALRPTSSAPVLPFQGAEVPTVGPGERESARRAGGGPTPFRLDGGGNAQPLAPAGSYLLERLDVSLALDRAILGFKSYKVPPPVA